jgi:iron complex outermembrane receptor protein
VRGSFDTWEGHGSTAGRRGALAGVLHVAYQGSAGDFRYLDGNGTPLNAADDSVVTRRNDRLDAATAIGTLLWTPRSGVLLRARQNWFQRAQGVPGLGAVPALHPRLVFRRSISQLEAEREAGGAWPALRLRGSLQREWERLRDTGAELGLGRHDTDDRLDGEDLGLQAEWSRLPLGLALQAVGALREERARLADAADGYPDPPGSGRESRGSALTLQWRTWRERLLISAGRRWDRQSDRLRSVGVGGALVQGDAERVLNTPQLGARLAAPLGFELRANWTRAQRAPEFLELFGDQGSVLGNPALRPERGENWDAGAAWSGTGPGGVTARLEYAHFASHARDYIVYVKNSQSSVRAQNVSRAEIAGDELALRLATPFGLSATATATWEKAVDHGPVPFWRGRDLPQRPRRQAHARLHWGRGRLGLDSQLELLGENFLDPANRQRVPARALAGASVSLALLGDALRLVVEGKNLGDERASDVGGFPLPGRSVFVSCESRLGGARARRS